MILLTNGDSWTQGDSACQTINWEAQTSLDWYKIVPNFGNPYSPCDRRITNKFYDSPIWPKLVGKALGVKTWNAGRLGDDNYGIFRRTINSVEYLLDQGEEDILVVIGWSSMLRIPIYTVKHTDKGTILLDQARPHSSNGAFDHMFKKAERYEDLFALTIFAMQSYLDSKGIKYLFFNAFDRFENFHTNSYRHLIDTNKWVDQDPIKAAFRDLIWDKFGLKDYSNSTYFRSYHPTNLSHSIWSEYLIDYIQNYLKDIKKV